MSADSTLTDDDSNGADPTADVQVAHQARFTADGEVTTEGEVTGTSLADFGADVDDRDPESRLDRPEASEFGVDDRPAVQRRDDGEQANLFADVDRQQRTLTGEQADARCLFEDATD